MLVSCKALLFLFVVFFAAPAFAQTEGLQTPPPAVVEPAGADATPLIETSTVQPQAAPSIITTPSSPGKSSATGTTPKPKAAPAKASGASAAAKRATKAPAQLKPSLTFDAELSGINNEISDTLFARVRVNRKSGPKEWFVRTSYALTSQDVISSKKNSTIKTTARQLDSEYRRNGARDYNFIAGAANIRTRNPANKTYPARSGYYFAYGGKGRRLGPKMEAGLGLGVLRDYDNGSRTQPALGLNARGQWPLSTRLLFDSQVLLIEPMDNGLKLDSEFGLQYRVMPGLFLRYGFALTNLIQPQRNTGDWNQTSRLSLLFRRSK